MFWIGLLVGVALTFAAEWVLLFLVADHLEDIEGDER